MALMPGEAVWAARRWQKVALLLVVWGSVVAMAQVSPGRLSKAHESLDTPLQCFRCHAAGVGKLSTRCYSCHEEIRQRVNQDLGFHARAMKGRKGDSSCAKCHAEHFGRIFNIISWKTSKEEFDHRETGYVLKGKHGRLKCEQCHQPKFISAGERALLKRRNLIRTLLGLTPRCAACHQDIHAGQLGTDCARCHAESGWKPPSRFQHDSAKYKLAGRHDQVECGKCHKPFDVDAKKFKYTGLAFADCTPCHQDPHKGAFPQRCESCHSLAGFKILPALGSFAHDRTKFPLHGKHASVPCLKCHKTANFHEPLAHARCLDCHQDIHKGQFVHRADGGECKACHNETKFIPAVFPVSEHQKTKYRLTGKHTAVKCEGCHKPAGPATDYHPAYGKCSACHQDAHAGQFAEGPWQNRCESCHDTGGFQPSTFPVAQHRKSRFPLPGAHAAVPCAECHRVEIRDGKKVRRFRFASLDCTGCHRDPHGLRSGDLRAVATDCSKCHTQNSWRTVLTFDHGKTKFALNGAHRAVACVSCHKPGRGSDGFRAIVFSPSPSRCSECHEDPHGGQFRQNLKGSDCSGCHVTARWKPSQFDHQTDTTFPLTGVHREVRCAQCHVKKAEIGGVLTLIYSGSSRKCAACHQ